MLDCNNKSDRSKKIVFFIPSMRGGGVEKKRIEIATELLRRGYAVIFLLIQKEGAYVEQVPDGVEVIELKSYSKRYFRTLLALPALVRYLKRQNPVVCFSSLTRNNTVAALATFFVNQAQTKIVVIEHIHLSTMLQNTNGIKSKLMPFFMSLLYRRAHRVVGVSKGVTDDILKRLGLPKELCTTIYNPVDIDKIERLQTEQVDTTIMYPDQRYIIGVGRLTPQKNFALLVDAFAEVSKHDTQLRLLILGEGPLRNKLEQQVFDLGLTEKVTMPGFVDNPYAYMARAEVFVLSSDWEGFGNVIVEALACGTSVVSTDCPSGPAEILQDGKYGSLVLVYDIYELGKAIQMELESPTTSATELKSRAQNFAVEKITDQYLELCC